MATPGPRHILRERLTARLAQASVGVVEAGAGFGKSVLASQYRQSLGIATAYVPLGRPDRDPGVLAGSLRRALAGARLSDLVAATGDAAPEQWIERLLDGLGATAEGILLVLDDAHHLVSEDAGDMVLRLAGALPPQHRLLINARSFPRHLEPLWRLPQATALDSGELAFTTEEARELFGLQGSGALSEHDVRVLIASTHGWATALVLAVAAHRVDGIDGAGPETDPVAAPLRAILEPLDDGDRESIVQLAHLPLLSARLCDRVGGRNGFFEWLVSRGIPLARGDSGWWEMPSPVAGWLGEQRAVSPGTVRAAAEEYDRAGARLAALRVLLSAGLADEAASRLGSMGVVEVEGLGLGVVRDLLGSMPDETLDRSPRALLHLARLAETAHESEARSAALERAFAGVPAGEPELFRELQAERARDLMWDERTRDEAGALANAVLEAAGEGEPTARARALDVLGRLASWFSATGPQPEAEGLLRESARLARGIGQPTWTAQALVALGAGYLFALCRYEQALTVLDQALGELPARNRYRAMVQSFRVDSLIELARWDEAEAAIAEMREIGEGVREAWILAFAAWAEAATASYMGDGDGCARAYREIDRHPGAWLEQPSGGECFAQIADHLSRVGHAELALQCLRRAEAKMEGNERIVRVHGAAVLARVGDPSEAEIALAEVLEGPAAEPHELWPIRLQQAHVALRLGDPARAGELAAAAFEYCGEIGHPEGPLVRERRLAEPLLPLAAEAGSAAARELMRSRETETFSIRLLGAFEVLRAGERLALPGGYPAKAVRIVAALGGRVHHEELIEWLWPEAGLLLGRNRLRNLMSRLRASAGNLLVRRDAMVLLSQGCELDTERFETLAQHALRAFAADDVRQAAIAARAALERYRGDLLPDDRYEEWSKVPRERLRAHRLELLDLLADAAEREGEIDEAVRLLTRAVEAEPQDESRYLRLAGLLASQGRVGSALAALDRCEAALEAAGVAISPQIERIRRELRPV